MQRTKLEDKHRVYPEDGVAPRKEFFRALRDTGFRGMLSLELFSQEYWHRPAAQVAKEGLEKTRAAVRASLTA